MQHVTRKDDISTLPMSVRLTNCLRGASLHTIGAMLDYPSTHEWQSINHMGAKTIAEVTKIISQLLSQDGDTVLVEISETTTAVVPEQQMIESDLLLSEAGLSVRALNALASEGITLMSQLVQLPDQKIVTIEGIGDRTYKDIWATVSRTIDKALTTFEISANLVHTNQTTPLRVTSDLVLLLHGDSRCCLREVLFVRKNYPEAIGESFFYRLYDTPYIQKLLKDIVIQLLEAHEEGISKKDLAEQLPNHLNNTTILEEMLIELESDDMVSYDMVMLKRKYPSIIKYARQLEDQRQQTILLGRLTGRTLEDIGQELDLTRERVRQLLNKQISMIRQQKLRFCEDRFGSIFSKYKFSLGEFKTVFGEPETTYNYLNLVYDNTFKKPFEEILNDDTLSAAIRRQCEPVIYHDYITIDGDRVKRDRPSLCHYFVRTCCTELTEYDDFLLVYHEWLAELGLQGNDALTIDAKSYTNKLNNADYVLWNQWRRFRYYNIASRDYKLLLTTLYIEQYETLSFPR